jgi:ATP-dependent phosphoenolpyruvate carboxykinase
MIAHMQVSTLLIPADSLIELGIPVSGKIHYQESPERLVRASLRLGGGVLNDTGALVINTGEFTGRSPKDKFIVRDEITEGTVNWNEFNIPSNLNISTSFFPALPGTWQETRTLGKGAGLCRSQVQNQYSGD